MLIAFAVLERNTAIWKCFCPAVFNQDQKAKMYSGILYPAANEHPAGTSVISS